MDIFKPFKAQFQFDVIEAQLSENYLKYKILIILCKASASVF